MKIWDAYRAAAHERMDVARAELAALERKGAQLVERVLKAESATLITAYEKEIVRLEESKALLAERSQSIGQSSPPFDMLYRTACAFLANPCILWDSGVLAHRKTFLRLVFPARLEYCRETGYRTGAIALPFRLCGQFALPDSKVVEGEGFEPSYA